MSDLRAPYQVLIIVFRKTDKALEYLLLKRADLGVWQWVAGGGETGESPKEAAERELFEETGIRAQELISLDSETRIPVIDVTGDFTWGHEVLVIPEHAFAYEVSCSTPVSLSDEHIALEWLNYDDAMRRLNWDSNRTALWEINERVNNGK